MNALSTSAVHAGAAVFVAFFLPLASPRLRAQTQEPKVEKPAVNATPTKRAQIEFSDATIQEVATFLSKQYEGVNLVVPADAAKQIVSLRLRNVGLDQVLQAISFATGGTISTEEISEGIYGFRLLPKTLPNGEPEPRAMVRVLSLAGIPQLGGESAPEAHEKVLQELQNALGKTIAMLRDADPTSTVQEPRLQFHPTTKLLIAIGKPEELGILEQLVTAMGGGFAPTVISQFREVVDKLKAGGGFAPTVNPAGSMGPASGLPPGIFGGGGSSPPRPPVPKKIRN